MPKKTPLYESHIALGGRMVEFAGYCLPVQFTGVIPEHLAVRGGAGLFDVSHMGEVILEGPDAVNNLNFLLTNDFSRMSDGRVRYTLMCNESGGVIDDLLVYRFDLHKYMLVLNASNIQKDIEWIRGHLTGGVVFADISDQTAEIALQGPASESILSKLTGANSLPEKYYTFNSCVNLSGCDCLVSRTGYTGEDGFEIYCKPEDARPLWDRLLAAGKESGLIPAGLGARDTLRLEAGMPLYGHEMNEEITPYEAGLGFAVKTEKEDFIGKQALLEKSNPSRKRAGLKMISRGIAREGCGVFGGGENIGYVTSGTHLPSLGYACAMALINTGYVVPGSRLTVDVRGKPVEAEVVSLPFYSRNK